MRAFFSSVTIAALLGFASPVLAGDLDGHLLSLQSAGASYEGSLSELVADAAITDAALASQLTSSDWRVRHQSAVALGWRQSGELYSALSGMQPIETRAGTVRFSGDFRGMPEAAPALLDRYLHGGEDAGTRAALVESLFFTGGDWGQALTELIDSEPSADVQVMMVSGLRDVEGSWALPALADAMSHADPEIRAEAAASAGIRADAASDDGVLDALVIALTDTDAPTRANAARSLGVLGADRAMTALEPLLTDEHAEARLNALRAISRIDAAAAATLPQLGALSQDSDARVARLADKIAGS